jgi:hypothetical protein
VHVQILKKVRDREDALASTRDACATLKLNGLKPNSIAPRFGAAAFNAFAYVD